MSPFWWMSLAGLRFYCFVGLQVFLLGTVNSSQALWICFPKLSPDAHCKVQFCISNLSVAFPTICVGSFQREQKHTPCPLQSQGVNPNQWNVQRLKSDGIYSIQSMETILSNSCARLRSGRDLLPKEPPWRMGAALSCPKIPHPCPFPLLGTKAAAGSNTVQSSFQWHPGCQAGVFLDPAFLTGPTDTADFPHPSWSPGPRAEQGFNFETPCTQPAFPHTNLSSSQPWKLETSFVFQRPKGQTCL